MISQTKKSGFLQFPLSTLLSSRSHVDVLRFFIRKNRPFGAGELISTLGLSRQGVYNTLKSLSESGIIEPTANPGIQVYVLRTEFSLLPILRTLFENEQLHFETFIRELATLFDLPEILSIWIFGKHSSGIDSFGDAIQIACLIDITNYHSVSERILESLRASGFEKRWDVLIHLHFLNQSELEWRPECLAPPITLLKGPDPSVFLASFRANELTEEKSHKLLDFSSAQAASVFAEIIQKHPELISQAVSYLEEKRNTDPPSIRKTTDEWLHLLKNASKTALKKILLEPSERRDRLLQSNPFWMAMTPDVKTTFENEQKRQKT